MKNADIAALVMDEGIAHLCFVKNNTTLIKTKIKKNIPKKGGIQNKRSKSILAFYENCAMVL